MGSYEGQLDPETLPDLGGQAIMADTMVKTPPMRSHRINTPRSPLHGAKYDHHEPYSTRRSTRQSSRRAAVTPEPKSPEHVPVSISSFSKPTRKAPSARRILHTYSPPSSTQASPKAENSSKVRAKAPVARKINFPRSPTSPGTASMDIFSDIAKPASLAPVATQAVHGLPTPAKTPRKQPIQNTAAVASAARVLFPTHPDTIDEVMPKTGRSRKGNRQVGLSIMGSDLANEDEAKESMNIFTDSRDRFPSLDRDLENPFIGHSAKPSSTTASRPSIAGGRRTTRRKAMNGVKENEEIKEAFDHEEGMVYVL